MARLCERPGCSQSADVAYGIDAEHLLVWLEPFDGAVGYRAGVLCRRHAEAMVVPLGWMLDDRREAVPRLFKPAETTSPTPVREKRRRSRQAGDDTASLQLELPLPPDPDDPAAHPVAGGEIAGVEAGPAPRPLDDASPVTVPPEDGTAPDEQFPDEQATPWEPSFDTSSDTAGLGEARSPLLARAFGRRGTKGRD